MSRLNKIGQDEYQGPHPFHDSTTEKNFTVNVRTNQWFCFRHNSGGGSLQYLAMKEGIINCEQAKKGALRGAKFKQVLQIAVSQGLIDEKILTQSEINPIILAKDIKEDYVFIVDKESGVLYYYIEKEGVYSDKTEQLIKREIVKRLDENTKARYYVEIENFITHSAPIVEMNSQPELIAVENGVLNVLTRELKPFGPNYYLTQKLSVKYDAEAQCPAIMKFLNEVLPEEKQQQIVQEYTGYSMYRKITYHVCLLFVGVGRNGKSKLLELITALLGKDNVSNQTIQSLCYNRFSLAELHHKLANISADLPSKELANTGIFKMIVGGDRLPGEHKHKDPFNFDNYAKLMFSCNRIPPIPSTEACLAFYTRFKILEFKNTFIGKKADKRIIDKLTVASELSGFLNYALDGLKQLEERKDFTEAMTQEETEKAYVKLSNSAQAFIAERIQVTDEYTDYVFTDWLYREFINYCHSEKLQTLPKAAFTKTMQEYCNGAEHTKIRPDKNSGPLAAWRYIKSVPRVPDVPPSQTILANCGNDNIDKISREKIVSKSGTNGTLGTKQEDLVKGTVATPNGTSARTEATAEENLIAAHCKKWHTGACPHPNPDCIVPLNTCPKTCGDFEEAEMHG
jgi:putative DNA primase/helicase